ncbi:hypothetical protein FA95DRAFT_1558463 [Auriscalpium vulgare]|uniref:Uncharacterized protein n=1 Tax=Auriscalpium vulgare TaxID=40419 RepID=A0ACB8RVT5_9AGAM|nr:hypothetical protein FA95DRAFT_1558463 [Auriscalpium vulgare]
MVTYSSRVYIDLMKTATSKWANWDPVRIINVGDYGEVDKDTGIFRMDGNIYAEGLVSGESQIIRSQPMDTYQVASKSVQMVELSASGEGNTPGVADAAVKAKVSFPEKGGVALYMHKPILSTMPSLHLGMLGTITKIKRKDVVTETYSCQAYFMCLTRHKCPDFELQLKAVVPVTAGVSAGGSVGLKWETAVQATFCQKGASPTGEYDFVPLFNLKRKPRYSRKRDSPALEDDTEIEWIDKPVPWKALNDEGEEFVDVVSDSEEE